MVSQGASMLGGNCFRVDETRPPAARQAPLLRPLRGPSSSLANGKEEASPRWLCFAGRQVFVSFENHTRNTVRHKQSRSAFCLEASVDTTGAWAAASSLEGRVYVSRVIISPRVAGASAPVCLSLRPGGVSQSPFPVLNHQGVSVLGLCRLPGAGRAGITS